MKVTALLTGRGNNTLKDKNVLEILGKPVLYYPANAGRKAKTVSSWYCSSDDSKILDRAEALSYIPIMRPAELALPTAQHIDAIMHGLEEIEKREGRPDILVVLLANNVTVKSEWIDDCVNKMKNDKSISAVVPVYVDNDHHPLRAKVMNKEGMLSMYEKDVKGNISTNRQDLPNCYFLSHNFWVLDVERLYRKEEGQQPWSFMGNRIFPYVIDESIDIHQEIDLYIAREWIRKNYTD